MSRRRMKIGSIGHVDHDKTCYLITENRRKILEKIVKALPPTRQRLKMLLPFSKGGAAAEIRKTGVIHSEEYTADGISVEAIVDDKTYGRLREFVVE